MALDDYGCDPEHPENCRIDDEKRAKELKATGGGLSNFFSNSDKPINDAIKNVASDICNLNGGKYDKTNDSCTIEDERITRFSELIGRQEFKNAFERRIKQGNLGNYLFVGDYGTGKTRFVNAIITEYAINHNINPADFFATNVLYVSGANGIDFIRDRVNHVIKTKGMGGDFKVIVLDEADQLSREAQLQLKSVFNEVYARHLPVSIFLMSNYPGKMMPDITSSGRFSTIEFGKLSNEEMKQVLPEKVRNLSADKVDTLISYSNGNIRALLDNSKRLEDGLPLHDYRAENIEQLTKEIEKEKAKLSALHDQKMIEINKKAQDIAWQYTSKEIVKSLADLSDNENAAETEMVLRRALEYRGMTQPQISSSLKEYEKELELEERRRQEMEKEMRLPTPEELGYIRNPFAPKQDNTTVQTGKYTGVVGQFYNQVKQLASQRYEFEEKGDKENVEATMEKIDYLFLAYSAKYPKLEEQLIRAEKDAFYDSDS